jgi:EpsI family protein
MANLKIRYLIAVLLLAATAIVVNGLQYDSSQEEGAGLADLQTFPMQIGPWVGRDFPLDAMVYEILETKAIIHRSFTDAKGDNVFLSIVHYHDTKVDFHAPESCIGGRGEKTKKTDKTLTLLVGGKQIRLNVAEMVTTRDTGQTLTYYFFKAGPFMGSSYIKMRLSIAANKLAQNDARGSLIRISTTLLPEHETEAEALLTDFLQQLLPPVEQTL